MEVPSTGSALATASDIHRQLPRYMADIRCDWLTNQNTDWCFVVIGLVGRQSHSPLQQLKIDPVRQTAPSRCQRIFINIRGQYSIQKNIYIHLWSQHSGSLRTRSTSVLLTLCHYVVVNLWVLCVLASSALVCLIMKRSHARLTDKLLEKLVLLKGNDTN